MPLQPAVASTAPGVGGRTLPDRLAAQTDTLLAKALAGVRNAQRPATSVTHAPTDPETAEGPPEKRRRTCVSAAPAACQSPAATPARARGNGTAMMNP